MTTVWQRGVEEAVHKRMEDAEACRVYCDVLKKMRNGWFDEREMNCISQKFAGEYDIYDAYCFAQIHSMIWSGEIVIVEVEMGGGPASDASVKYNDDALKRMVPPFSGNFIGKKKVIITAWRYPGKSPVREAIPMPADILEELKNIKY